MVLELGCAVDSRGLIPLFELVAVFVLRNGITDVYPSRSSWCIRLLDKQPHGMVSFNGPKSASELQDVSLATCRGYEHLGMHICILSRSNFGYVHRYINSWIRVMLSPRW